MDLRAATDPTADPALQRLLAEARPRSGRALEGRERATEVVAALAFTAAACAAALTLPRGRPADLALGLALVAVYAFAARVRFYVGAGYTIPTQLVFVPMLFLLPLAAVPALVALGLAASKLPEVAAARLNAERAVAMSVADAWHSLGPVVVLGLAGAGDPSWADWPLYLAALAAQLATDLAASTLRERFALGIAAPLQAPVLAWVYLVDVLLAPVGLLVAFVALDAPQAVLLAVPLLVLLRVLAREREQRIEDAIELSRAYRGTALLLGDVLEGSDEYTGTHSRSVVTLSLDVADAMGLDSRRRRNVEFAALLHDIGKIAIPDEILHKPAPLDDSEWRVMKTHTLEGDRMLRMVGGVLADAGRVVRSTHERWDGRGYPDGLAGERIPIEACIVSCCDAFDAMTTDRVYRRAMSVEVALDELRANAGTQFNPQVVDALVEVVERAREAERVAEASPLPPLLRRQIVSRA
jgi:HD-GYP domain-containing protein (c-di-GMP phosphodiesterase class II)